MAPTIEIKSWHASGSLASQFEKADHECITIYASNDKPIVLNKARALDLVKLILDCAGYENVYVVQKL